MLSVGVDLAAGYRDTAVAYLEWFDGGAAVRNVVRPADDDAVIRAVMAADKAGIDCPLGWPNAFVAFVDAHQAGRLRPPQDESGGAAWRRRLVFRVTDEVVREATNLVPLSVAADRIAHPAMRCAALMARLAQEGRPVERSGDGVVVEVYPAASLKKWGTASRAGRLGAQLPAGAAGG
jgi:predicted nuclease with RNAse H fold